MIGEGPCVVKTLTRNHLYCEPPAEQPLPRHHALREAPDALPEFTVSEQALGWARHGACAETLLTGGSPCRCRWATCTSPWATCSMMARAPWLFPWQPRWAWGWVPLSWLWESSSLSSCTGGCRYMWLGWGRERGVAGLGRGRLDQGSTNFSCKGQSKCFRLCGLGGLSCKCPVLPL